MEKTGQITSSDLINYFNGVVIEWRDECIKNIADNPEFVYSYCPIYYKR
jgi:hypothetical protein